MERDLEQLNSALNSVKVLRSNVRRVFESVSNGLRADHGEEGKENKFILELQDILTTVNNNLRYVIVITVRYILFQTNSSPQRCRKLSIESHDSSRCFQLG